MPKLPAAKARIPPILACLAKLYPDAECALVHENPLQLLIATILSAQCTDKRVNLVTPALFARYCTAADFANADRAELEGYIQSTGFFRNKAKNVIAASRRIVELHGGEVPRTMDELTALPGVARKTANVVLGSWFREPAGVVVDTHCQRLARRLRFTRSDDPVKIERDLMDLLPRERWTHFSHGLVFHGRRVCSSRKPRCSFCRVRELCPSRQDVREAKKLPGKYDERRAAR